MKLNARFRQSVLLPLLIVPAMTCAQTAALPDPSDPQAKVPDITYKSVLPRFAGGLDHILNAPHLPWKELYQPDGRFVPESALGNAAVKSMQHEEATTEDMKHGAHAANMNASNGSSDARGVVKEVYVGGGKLKLEHGPIEKLEMPAMTMIFYVKNPTLIEGLKIGDEIGFDIELKGTTLYIMRIER